MIRNEKSENPCIKREKLLLPSLDFWPWRAKDYKANSGPEDGSHQALTRMPVDWLLYCHEKRIIERGWIRPESRDCRYRHVSL